MHTDPLTASRYPDSTDSPNVAQYIQNAVMDLSDNTIPRFATTTARDSAYSAYVSAGGAMANGMTCWCDSPGAYFDRIGGAWVQRGVTKYGGGSFATGSTGYFTVTHGLGSVPSYVNVTDRVDGALGGHTWAVSAVSSTTFTCRAYYNNAPDSSVTVTIYWEVRS